MQKTQPPIIVGKLLYETLNILDEWNGNPEMLSLNLGAIFAPLKSYFTEKSLWLPVKKKEEEEQVTPQPWDLMTRVHLHPLDF